MDFGVSAQAEGEDLARIFNSLIEDEDSEDESGQPVAKRVKFTIMDAVADSDLRERAELIELSSTLPRALPMAAKRLQMHLREFVLLHWPNPALGGNELGGGLLKGRERQKDGFVERLCDYLTIRLLRSVKRDKITGQPILDVKTGNKRYLSVGGLEDYTKICMNLLKTVPFPALTPRESTDGISQLRKHTELLVKRYSLTTHSRRLTTLFPVDVRAMVEHVLEDPGDKWDIAVQDACLLLTFMYLGARPGSVVKTRHWPNDFSTWKDISWRPARDEEGKILGFDVRFTLKSFKGYHMMKNLKITFQVKTIRSEKNAVLDFGTLTIAHGHRAGIFGQRTIEDLLSTDLLQFKCDPEYDDSPIFLSKNSRTHLGVDPLMADKANEVVQRIMRELRIISQDTHCDTVYALRRGFATNVGQNLGKAVTVLHMGQRANTTMFEDTYNQAHLSADMTEGLIGPGEATAKVATALSLTRSKNLAANPSPEQLREAVKMNPTYRHWYAKYQFLLDCDRRGSSAWQEVKPYKSAFKKGDINAGSIKIIIAKYKAYLKTLARNIKEGQYRSVVERNTHAADELDYQTILQRVADSEKPSDLAQKLQARLLKKEENFLVDENAEYDKEDVQDVYEIDTGAFEDEDTVEEPDLGEREEDYDDDDREGETEIGGANQAGPSNTSGKSAELAEVGQAQRQHLLSLEQSFTIANGSVLPEAARSEIKTGEPIISATNQKMTLLRSLCEFIDSVRDNFIDAPKESALCDLCLEDDTCPEKDKTKIHGKTTLKYKRHLIEHHDPKAHSDRWLKTHEDGEGCFHCPMLVPNEDDPEGDPVVCGTRYYKGSSRATRVHLYNFHYSQLSETLRIGLDPDTAKEQAAERRRRKEELATLPATDVTNRPNPSATVEEDTDSGMSTLMDYALMSGGGFNIIPSGDISFDQNALDMSIFDEDGFLI